MLFLKTRLTNYQIKDFKSNYLCHFQSPGSYKRTSIQIDIKSKTNIPDTILLLCVHFEYAVKREGGFIQKLFMFKLIINLKMGHVNDNTVHTCVSNNALMFRGRLSHSYAKQWE